MRNHRPLAIAAALAAAALSACGGSSPVSGPAKISVRLVDSSTASSAAFGDPNATFDEVNIDIRSVEIWSESDGWVTLATMNCDPDPDACIENLLSLTWDGTKGVYATLVDGHTLGEGRYGQMRLLLGPNNTVKLKGATGLEPLKVPSGEQSGVKMTVNFEVQPGTTKDVYIDFSAHRSVFVHGAGKSGKYILRPTVRAYDKLETGTIQGTLMAKNAPDQAPVALQGVTVTAQTLSDTGIPTVVATTLTNGEGNYVFHLIEADVSHYVVAQPYVPDTAPESTTAYTVYPAKTSGAITVTPAEPIRTWDATFEPVDGGAIRATVGFETTPPLDDTPLSVQVRKGFDVGGGQLVTLTVREASPLYVAEDPPVYPVVEFANLPVGSFDVVAGRPSGSGFAYGSAESAIVEKGAAASVSPKAP
jgi:hypothetical protein